MQDHDEANNLNIEDNDSESSLVPQPRVHFSFAWLLASSTPTMGVTTSPSALEKELAPGPCT